MTYVQLPKKNRHASAGTHRCPECGSLVKDGRECARCAAARAAYELKRIEGRPVTVTKADGAVETVQDRIRFTPEAPAFTYSRGNVKLCKKCGRPFSSQHGQLYCSERCKPRGERTPKTIACAECGGEFARRSPADKYCSAECKRQAVNRRARERDREKRERKPLATMECPVCGEVFTQRMPFQKYCSSKCGGKARDMERKKRKKWAPRECKRCGREFVPTSGGRLYCSRECKLARHDEEAR